LEDKLPIVKDILQYRSLTKLVSTYMKNAKEYIKDDGRARLSVLIHGTVNGRPSARFLHQIPRLDHSRIAAGKSNLRDMFIAEKGYKLVYGDYSQIELVTLAIQSGDTEMLNVFKSGEDIHRATAAAFLDVPIDQVNDFNRSIGKSINFGRVYGSVDGYSLMKLTWQDANGVEKPLTEGMIRRGFEFLDERFPSASRYFEDTVNEISALNGVYITRFGREKRMGTSMNSANEYARKEAERQAVNGSIQSPAASVTIRTLNAMNTWIEERIEKKEWIESDGYLTITVHDSGLWEIKDDKVQDFVAALKEISNRKVPQLDDFQFTMKIGIGKSWSQAELNSK
jgi:DNA polymerase I